MALLNKSNMYVKLNKDGCYKIYATKEDRDKEKNATPYETIESKYLEIIDALIKDEERQYYDDVSWSNEFTEWSNEFNRYSYNYQIHKTGEHYPLMKEIYNSVEDSIVNIIEEGCICTNKETENEIYSLAKERQYWGETEDI